jgi:hypothetical protein
MIKQIFIYKPWKILKWQLNDSKHFWIRNNWKRFWQQISHIHLLDKIFFFQTYKRLGLKVQKETYDQGPPLERQVACHDSTSAKEACFALIGVSEDNIENTVGQACTLNEHHATWEEFADVGFHFAIF